MLAYKKNLASRILCCFCGDKVIMKDVEAHLIKCKSSFEYEIKESYKMPNIYQDLFIRINDDNFVASDGSNSKEIFIQEFNKKAEVFCKDFERKRILIENEPLYREKLNSIPKEKLSSSEFNYDIEVLIKDSLDIFLMYNKLKIIDGVSMNDIFCFLCGRFVNFWGFEPHLRSCCKNYEIDKTSKIILQKPNFNIIQEALSEKERSEADEYFVEFLINEFNKDSEKIFNSVYSKGRSIKLPKRERFSSSTIVTPTSKKIVVRRLDKNQGNNSNQVMIYPNNYSIVINKDLSLRCFICGDFFENEDFQMHYLKCKSEAPQINIGEKISEFSEFLNKLVMGNTNEDDVKKYNIFAENIYWDVVCRPCNICGKKVNPLNYERHSKSCQEKMHSEMNCNNQAKISVNKKQRIRYTLDLEQCKEQEEKRKMRKKSMDDIRNYDIKQVRNNIKYYFI